MQQMPHVKLRDGAELYYEKQGSGPPLFLVPGLGGDGRFWDADMYLVRIKTKSKGKGW